MFYYVPNRRSENGAWNKNFVIGILFCEQQYYQDSVRIEAAFRSLLHRADTSQKSDSYELVVCHGNVIRYFMCRALQLPPEAWLRMSLHHCSVTLLTIRPNGRVHLRAFGDCGHLPPHQLTTS